ECADDDSHRSQSRPSSHSRSPTITEAASSPLAFRPIALSVCLEGSAGFCCGQSTSSRSPVSMEPQMASDASESQALIRRVERGDERALAELFAHHRGRLRRMVKLRLDHRLQGRLDPSDVLQEAYLEIAKRSREYLANPEMPVFLWLRWITGEKLLALHRRHL